MSRSLPTKRPRTEDQFALESVDDVSKLEFIEYTVVCRSNSLTRYFLQWTGNSDILCEIKKWETSQRNKCGEDCLYLNQILTWDEVQTLVRFGSVESRDILTQRVVGHLGHDGIETSSPEFAEMMESRDCSMADFFEHRSKSRRLALAGPLPRKALSAFEYFQAEKRDLHDKGADDKVFNAILVKLWDWAQHEELDRCRKMAANDEARFQAELEIFLSKGGCLDDLV